MPFCCCSFRMVLGGSLSCQTGTLPQDRLGGARLIATVEHSSAPRACCHGESASEGVYSGLNSEDNPTDDPQGCSCDKGGGKMLSVEKPSVEAPVHNVVALIDWSQRSEVWPLDLASARERIHQAVQRPLTSLVRMHCALIV